MLLKARVRNRCVQAGCRCCDDGFANVKGYRRRVRRVEKRMWKTNLREGN